MLASLLCSSAACSSDWSIGTLPKGDVTNLQASALSEELWATDGRALYELSLATGAFSAATPFRNCALEVVEITFDEGGVMFGAGYENGSAALYKIDPQSGACTVMREFSTSAPWSVGFFRNTLLADESGSLEVLSSMNGVRESVIAPLPMMQRAGCDIVARDTGSSFVSALVDWNRASATNVLEEIDPGTGRVLQRYTMPHGTVLEGLASSSAGDLYGFARDGHVVRVSFQGDAVTLVPIATSNGPEHFTGAASTMAGAPR